MSKKILPPIFVVLLFLSYHFYTMPISPLAMGDEIFFHSVSKNFAEQGTLHFTADLGYDNGRQILAYGPVFFILNAISIKLFGSGIIAARLLSVICGLLIVLVMMQWFKAERKKHFPLFLMLLFCFDPFYSSSLHIGRNDSVALLFFLFSAFSFYKYAMNHAEEKTKSAIKFLLLSAFSYSLSILTTTRIFMLTAAFAGLMLYLFSLSKNKNSFFKQGFIWAAIVIAVYSSWVFYAFGGYINYYNYYHKILAVHSEFVGGGLWIPKEVLPLLACFALLFLAKFIFNRQQLFKSPALIFCGLILISFFSLVGDTGPYSALWIPIVYLSVGILCDAKNDKQKIYKIVSITAISILVLFNISAFALKNVVLIADSKNRNMAAIEAFIKKNIPAEKAIKVCADEMYYYPVINNQNTYHVAYTFPNRPDSVMEKYSRQNFDYDYLIISNKLKKTHPEIVRLYFQNANLIVVDTYAVNASNPISKWLSAHSKFTASADAYNGILYKRKR